MCWAGLGDYGRVALIGCAWGWVVLLKNVGCSSEWAPEVVGVLKWKVVGD